VQTHAARAPWPAQPGAHWPARPARLFRPSPVPPPSLSRPSPVPLPALDEARCATYASPASDLLLVKD